MKQPKKQTPKAPIKPPQKSTRSEFPWDTQTSEVAFDVPKRGAKKVKKR